MTVEQLIQQLQQFPNDTIVEGFDHTRCANQMFDEKGITVDLIEAIEECEVDTVMLHFNVGDPF